MTKQIFGIFSWMALAALFLGSCQSAPAADSGRTSTEVVTLAVSATPHNTATPSEAATFTAGPSPIPTFRKPLWTFAAQGEIWGSPAVSGGTVYFGSENHFLYAVNIATHDLKWKFETGGRVRSRPAVSGGTAYFTGDDNILYAVDAETGVEVWRFDMGKPLMPRDPSINAGDYMQSSPAVAEGTVYVGSANPNFFAVDAATGIEKWRFKVTWLVRSSPAVVDGVVYFGDWESKFYALDAQTGLEKWNFSTEGSVAPSPTIVDGVVYIGSKFPCLYALDAQTGKQKWCFEYPSSATWVESSAAVANGVVYVGSSAWYRVNAIDAATGELKWKFVTEGYPWSSPAVSEGVVYIGATGGYLYALNADLGTEVWRLQTGKGFNKSGEFFNGGVISSPVVFDGAVYFGGLDGKLYAVSTAP